MWTTRFVSTPFRVTRLLDFSTSVLLSEMTTILFLKPTEIINSNVLISNNVTILKTQKCTANAQTKYYIRFILQSMEKILISLLRTLLHKLAKQYGSM